MQVLHIVGARPNFMKADPVIRALSSNPAIRQKLLHSGQHFDRKMSGVFFEELGLPQPDINLEVGQGSHCQQTANIMLRSEPVLEQLKPDFVLLYGDVNSTVAAALVCAKLRIKIAHVEAGLRSFDRSMPEEINRIVTDQLADIHFTPSKDADANLIREGVDPAGVYFVGNVMIDTLVRLRPIAKERFPALRQRFGLDKYGLLTLHRPSNVDDPEALLAILFAIQDLGKELRLLFPLHPRTKKNLGSKINELAKDVLVTDPLSYVDFLALQQNASLVITDSGGIQEEATFLGVPCLTLRENTERPVTVSSGTNVLVGRNMDVLRSEVRKILGNGPLRSNVPPLWDGHAGERIAKIFSTFAARGT